MAGTLPEVCRSCIVGADVVASTASGTRAASFSGRPSPPRGLLKYLLLRLQCQMPSLRFGCAEQPHNQEKAGDVLESVGGFLSPLHKRVAVVSRELGREYGWWEDDVRDALRSLTHFVEAASCAWAHASAEKALFASFLSTHFDYGGAGGDFSGAGCDCVACAVRRSASFSASNLRLCDVSGSPGLCVGYEGGDAPAQTLAASFSASGPRQPQASGPPGLSGECEGGDIPLRGGKRQKRTG